MGQPDLYAVEIPVRAHKLLTALWGHVDGVYYEDFGGPLGTTFLLAMGTPMLNFPFERLEKDDPAKSERRLHGKSMQGFNAMIDNTRLGQTPFFGQNAWRYTFVKGVKPNLISVDPAILDSLSSGASVRAAKALQTKVWFSVLRNALAHSAVVYLDEEGRQAARAPTKMIAFLSERREMVDKKLVVTGSHVLRIDQAAFREFLDAWAQWLRQG